MPRPGRNNGPTAARPRPVQVAIAVGALLLVALAALTVLPTARSVHAATPGAEYRSAHVLMLGIAGLRWDDVSEQDTPALWALSKHGSVGTLTARSASPLTCPADGWLSLGAGGRAQLSGEHDNRRHCPDLDVPLDETGGSTTLAHQDETVSHNLELATGSRPGALAEAVPCTTSAGPGAAVAAARPVGRIDRYVPLPDLLASPSSLLDSCPLSLIDAGVVDATGHDARVAQVRAADAVVARVLADRPAGSTVLVAGVSDTSRPARMHVAIADGPGFGAGWLSSSGTDRTGYVQLIDIAPTVLAVLGRHRPDAFAGEPWLRDTSRPAAASPAAAREAMVDADRVSVSAAANSGRFVAVLVAGQIVLYLMAALALVRLPRGPGPGPTGRRTSRWPAPSRAVVETAASAAALLIPSMLLADLVPWWRAPRPGLLLVGVVLVVMVALTAAVRVGPWRRYPFGRTIATATVSAAVIGVDALTGAHLELDNVVGYAAVTGDRYTGLGMIGLGGLLAAVLMLAGCVATRVARHRRPVVVALIGAMAVLVVGSPALGEDPGGAIGVTAGVAVAAVVATGGWLTLTRLGWSVLAGIAVTGGFALLDLTRPPDERGHLGRFFAHLFGGSASPALARVAEANLVATMTSLLTVLVAVVAVFWAGVLLRPSGGLRRVYGLYPAVRGALLGCAVAGAAGGLLDGAGLIVLGAAASVTVPLAIQCCLRVRDGSVLVPKPPGTDATPLVVPPPDR